MALWCFARFGRVTVAGLGAVLLATSCASAPPVVSEEAVPPESSTSHARFLAHAPIEAGSTIPATDPLTLVVTLGRRLPPKSQLVVAFPTGVQEESDALWQIPTLDETANGLLIGGSVADRVEIVQCGRVRGGAGRVVARATRALDEGEELELGFTGPAPQIANAAKFRIWEVDGGDGSVAALPPTSVEAPPVVAAPAVAVRTSMPSDTVVGAPTSLRLVALDRFGNVDAAYRGRCELAGPLAGLPSEYRFEAEDEGIAVLDGLRPTAAGVLRVRAKFDVAAGVESSESNPSRVWPSRPRFARYFGDTHFHTGSNVASYAVPGGDHRGQFVSADVAFAYLRDAAGLDWGISAEHDTGMTSATWLADQKLVDALNDSGRFVTLLGYEWTPERRLGHHVVVFENGPSAENPLVAAERAGPGGADAVAGSIYDLVTELRRRLWGKSRAIAIPHVMQPFPNRDPERKGASLAHEIWDGPAGTRPHGYNFDDLRRVAEIYSHHNDDFTANGYVQTTKGRGDSVDQPQLFELGVGNPWSLQHAWANGQRVGVVGGSDNHLGTPGMDNFSKSIVHHAGLAVVLAPELTRAAIFDALYARRCYATTGPRILLDFTAAGLVMGSETYLERGSAIPVAVTVEGTAPLASVEVLELVDGDFAVAKSVAGDGASPSATLAFSDTLDAPTIFYVRVRQTDGEMAWSSPIWIDVKN
jgi:hypothetical protein